MKKLFTLLALLWCTVSVAFAGDTYLWVTGDRTATQTLNGDALTTDFFTHNSQFSSKGKHTGTYVDEDGKSWTSANALKVASSTQVKFTTSKAANIIIVNTLTTNFTGTLPATGHSYLKFDGTDLNETAVENPSADDANVGVTTLTNVEAGEHIIGRGSKSGESGLMYIKVTYIDNGLGPLNAPVITYDENMLVTITKPEGAVKVCYTTDGTNPTADSAEYTEPFTVADGTVVNAIAIGDGTTTDNSPVASITVLAPITEVAVPVFTQYNGTFALTCATAGATLEYSLDGTTFVAYTIPVTLTETTTVSARAKYLELVSEVATQEITALPTVEKTATVILDYNSFTQTGNGAETPYVFEGKGESEGYSLAMADAPAKKWGYGAEITVNGQKLKSIHGSNGQTITVSIPEGYKATRIVLYSVEANAGNTSKWADVCGEANPIDLVSADATNPDIRIYNIAEGTAITFRNSGDRPDFVIVLEIVEPAPTSATLVAYNVKDQTNAGYTISGTSAEGSVTVNGVKTSSLQLKNAWNGDVNISTETQSTGNNFIKLTTDGGFKKGDVLTINGVISNKDPNKNGAICVYANDINTHIGESGLFINTELDKTAPASEYILTLPCDAEVLYISRAGVENPTATHITMIKLERNFESVEVEPLADPELMLDGAAVSEINLEGGIKTVTVQAAAAHHNIYYYTECEYVAPAEPAAAPARAGAKTLTHEGVVYKQMPAEGVQLDKDGTFSFIAHDPATDARSAVKSATVSGGATTAISEIEAAQGEATYYNLQGQKVETPAAGLYIRVQNGKASKVVVK